MTLLAIDYESSGDDDERHDKKAVVKHVDSTNGTMQPSQVSPTSHSRQQEGTLVSKKSTQEPKKSAKSSKQAYIQEQIEASSGALLQHSDSEEAFLEKSKQLLRPPISIELPPEPPGECDPGLQAKIDKWIQLKQSGLHFNDRLNSTRSFRNPSILTQLINYLKLDQYGSNLPTSVFDPHGFPNEAFYEELGNVQKQRFQTPTFVSSGHLEPTPAPAQVIANVNAPASHATQKAKRFAQVLAQQSTSSKGRAPSPVNTTVKKQRK